MHLFQHRIAVFGLCCLVTLISPANKNGRAASQGRGNTGAPGDETSLGLPKTCQNCHNQGPITAALNITVLDASGQTVQHYLPGQNYTARVKITASGTGLQGYGFQMIALRDAGNTDLDGFTDVNPNNYKVATISNGRTYAEHDNISVSNTFEVRWKAPVAGTGSVTFYASGNGVNANGTTSGDGAGATALQLTESGAVDAVEPEGPEKFVMYPNPVAQTAFLQFGSNLKRETVLRVMDLQGRLVERISIPAGDKGLEISAVEWPSGILLLQLEGVPSASIVKIVKL